MNGPLRATALDLPSEDYESKTYKPFVENAIQPIDVLSILLQTEVTQQSGLTKMAAVNFLSLKMKQ